MNFKELNLPAPLKEKVAQLKFETLTEIQEKVFQYIQEGKDISGLAPTGTGKTLAYLLPIAARWCVSENPEVDFDEKATLPIPGWDHQSKILVIVPTRELADQVISDFEKVKLEKWEAISLYGGIDIEAQIKKLKNDNPQLLVATPGRLIDLYKRHHIDLKNVKATIFDEADRLFDMGFKDDIKYVLNRVEERRQMIAMSATMDSEVIMTCYEFNSEPIEIDVSQDEMTSVNVDDQVFHISRGEKAKYLYSLLKKGEEGKKVILFTNFKKNIPFLESFLKRNGFKCLGLSSLMNQSQRNRVMQKFAEEDGQILIASDVAARGIDIKDVDLVINYDVPSNPEVYVHRIGRTGRAGSKGVAYSLSSEYDIESLQRLERYLGDKITIGWLEDTELMEPEVSFQTRLPEDKRIKKYVKDNSYQKGAPKKTGKTTGKKGPYKSKSSGNNPDGKAGASPKKELYRKKRTDTENFETHKPKKASQKPAQKYVAKKTKNSSKSDRYKGFKKKGGAGQKGIIGKLFSIFK